MRMTTIVSAAAALLLLTGCWGANWVASPGRVKNIEAGQVEMSARIDSLSAAVENTEALVRGLSAQSVSRTAELVDRIEALTSELERALQKLGEEGTGPATQDSLAGPGAQVLYDEAYLQYQQGNYPVAFEGFMDLFTSYPTSSLADDAMYFMALSRQSMGEAHEAVEDLVALYYLYPDSDRAPAALARAAAIYGAHSASDDRDRLNGLLLDHYPDSEEAILVRESLGGDR
jgi:TolA-binding protein